MKKGKFIVIEGLDGSGSTTQINLLAKYLKEKKVKVITTKEPTDNVIGGLIRGALTNVYTLPESTLQLLFAADRGHHLQRMVEPALEKGFVVISDRYFWSTVAFGSLTLDRNWLMGLQKYFRMPDFTIILKVSPRECMKRITENRSHIELYEKENKLKNVWKTYLWLKRKFSKKIDIVDGEGKIEDVNRRIIKIISDKLDL